VEVDPVVVPVVAEVVVVEVAPVEVVTEVVAGVAEVTCPAVSSDFEIHATSAMKRNIQPPEWATHP